MTMTWLLTTAEIEQAAQDAAKPLESEFVLLEKLQILPGLKSEARAIAQAQLRKVVELLQGKGKFRHILYGVEPATGKSLKMLEIELYLEDWEALLQEALR